MIYDALGDRQRAAKYLKQALDAHISLDNTNASFGVLQADAARQRLKTIL